MAWRWSAVAMFSIMMPGGSVGQQNAPPPLADCIPGPYIIFFDLNSSAIKKDAVEVLDNAVENTCFKTGMIAGHSDTSENPAIAHDRAIAVRNYLASRGVLVAPRHVLSFGATSLRVKTAAKTPERQNRRVEFTYGPD